MPSTYLTEKTKRDEEFRRVIRMGMARKGIGDIKKLSDRVKMSRSTLSKKMADPDLFKLGELRRVYKTLGMEFPIDKEGEAWL